MLMTLPEFFSRLADHLNTRLKRFYRVLFVLKWAYTSGRVVLDLTTFFQENGLKRYIRNDLLLDPNGLHAGFKVLAAIFAIFNIVLQRLVTSTGLTIIVLTYISVNLVRNVELSR